MRFLLAAGADANCHLEGLYTLHAAASGGRIAVMTALLDAGARSVDEALGFAACAGHVSAAALLLSRGADIHHKNDAALRFAAFYGRLEMVAFLLDNGADLHALNNVAPSSTGAIWWLYCRRGAAAGASPCLTRARVAWTASVFATYQRVVRKIDGSSRSRAGPSSSPFPSPHAPPRTPLPVLPLRVLRLAM